VSALVALAKKVQQQALLDNFRQIIRLQGEQDWCFEQAKFLIEQLQQSYFWLGEAPDAISVIPYRSILGQECELLVINALSKFDANMFAASEGCLKGGGLLILLCPTQMAEEDLFYHYIQSQLALFDFITVKQNHPLPKLPAITAQNCKHQLNLKQQSLAVKEIIKTVTGHRRRPLVLLAVKEIIKTVTGHRRRPLVLTANRGRGKSAALGIASAYLLENGLSTILV